MEPIPFTRSNFFTDLAIHRGPFVGKWIEDVTRTGDRLCWTWASIKVRDLVSDDMAVFLTTRTDRMVVAVFERDTGLPWGRSRAVGLDNIGRPPASCRRRT